MSLCLLVLLCMCVCEFVVDCSCERIDDAESSFPANAPFCSKCPDGFVCESGLLVGQKQQKNSLDAGVIAAIVVGSVATCIIIRAMAQIC